MMITRDACLYEQEGLPFDPEKWVTAALMAGLKLELRPDGWLVVDVMDAETSDAILLMGWLGENHEELALYLANMAQTVH
ncbi:MAG: hypothetical protein QNJ94_05095 [Alphaproteobacteria bacterium]|nr:hypothetical protein [Alphaproteobacteria bacterium]